MKSAVDALITMALPLAGATTAQNSAAHHGTCRLPTAALFRENL
jgi:hypothetical protein